MKATVKPLEIECIDCGCNLNHKNSSYNCPQILCKSCCRKRNDECTDCGKHVCKPYTLCTPCRNKYRD